MYCKFCGKAIPGGAAVCPVCGRELRQETVRRTAVWGLVMMAMIVLYSVYPIIYEMAATSVVRREMPDYTMASSRLAVASAESTVVQNILGVILVAVLVRTGTVRLSGMKGTDALVLLSMLASLVLSDLARNAVCSSRVYILGGISIKEGITDTFMIPSLWLWAGFAFLLLARSTKQRIRAKYILIPGAIMVSQAWVLYFFYYPIANIFDAIFAEFDFYAHGMLYREALLLPVVFLVYTWFFCIWGRQTLPAVGLALFPAVRCVIYALLLWIFVVDEWSFWVNEWIGAISLLLPALLAKLAVRRAKKPSHAAEG